MLATTSWTRSQHLNKMSNQTETTFINTNTDETAIYSLTERKQHKTTEPREMNGDHPPK